MKKTLLLTAITLSAISCLHSKELSDTLIEKKGWIIYSLGHAIWFDSNLPTKNTSSSFFATDTSYRNGLTVDYLTNPKLFKFIAPCYKINVLWQIDSITKKAAYIGEEQICILPAKAKIRPMPETEQFDEAAVSFKRKNNEVTIIYWSATDYFVVDVELLYKKDNRRLSRYIKRNPIE